MRKPLQPLTPKQLLRRYPQVEDEAQLVDGGYISWVYGSSIERYWLFRQREWMEFSKKRGTFIVMDNPHLYRKDFYPSYKGHRDVKVLEDEGWAKKVELVHQFRDVLRTDERLQAFEIDGFEADDLITALALQYWAEHNMRLRVLAMDKDLLQCADFLELTGVGINDGKRSTLDTWREKQQKTLQPYLTHHRHILLTLAIMGDKSDDVPRLLPSRRLEMMIEILTDPDPWKKASKMLGPQLVAENLYMTVLPGPWCFTHVRSPKEVFKMVRSNLYLGQQFKPEFRELYQTYLSNAPYQY